jgi:hypothetical protein
MNPYFKSTKGYNAEVTVGNATDYTALATLALFADTAPEGAIGVYDAKTNALITTAAAVGTELIIAQKRDGAVHATSPFKVSAGFATYTVATAGALNAWTVDFSAVVAEKGLVLELATTELTTGAQPYHTTNWDVTMRAGETVAAAMGRLAAKIANKASLENYAYLQLATASVNGNVLTVSSLNKDRYFKLLLRNGLEDAVAVQSVKPATGSGSYEGIAALEGEGVIFDGVTTNYPLHGLPSEYGEPTKFASRSLTYDVLMLTPWREQSSPMPFHKHTHKSYIVIAVPSTGVSAREELRTVFGFAPLV